MNILVIDGMGGGMGKAIIERIRAGWKDLEITAAGTNALATAAMLKAGATQGATGENAIVYNCRHAHIIVGAMGIVLANAMLGEISPAIAQAVSASSAHRILVPVPKCNTSVLGIAEKPLSQYLAELPARIRTLMDEVKG